MRDTDSCPVEPNAGEARPRAASAYRGEAVCAHAHPGIRGCSARRRRCVCARRCRRRTTAWCAWQPAGPAFEPDGSHPGVRRQHLCCQHRQRPHRGLRARRHLPCRPSAAPAPGRGSSASPATSTACAAEPSLLVLDAGNDRVQKLSLNGVPVAGFNGPSGSGFASRPFSAPQGITADVDGRFWSPTGNDRVQAFAADGTYLETIGEGALRPRGVALGPDGTLYVSDSGHNQVVAYALAHR